MSNKIDFYINFGGFYHSIYSDVIDNLIINEIQDGYIKNDDDINYKCLYNKVAEHIFDNIVEFIQDETELDFCSTKIKYKGLSSPKYYNYSTDKIIASIDIDVFNILKNHFNANHSLFVDYVNEYSKSQEGFISFYDGFNEVSNEPSVLLEYIFDFVQHGDKHNELIDSILDDICQVIYTNL